MNRFSLETEFCGIKFPNPFVLAAAPGTDDKNMLERAFEAGWGGAVMKTVALDCEPVELVSPMIWGVSYENKRLMGMENIDLITERKISVVCQDIKHLKAKFPKQVMIGSIMASCEADWKEAARMIQNSGADMLECSFSCPHGMPDRGMGSAIGQNPELTLRTARWVREAVDIPVLIKLTPNVTDIVPVARAVKEAGCAGVTLINTVKALLGIDLETFSPLPTVGGKSTWGGYSGPAIKPIALRFISTVAKNLNIPISGVGGVSTWQDAAEFLLCGAGTVQLCTAPMHYGFAVIEDLVEGLNSFLQQKGMRSVAELIGKALPNLVSYQELAKDCSVVSRVNREICLRDNLCFVACRDGGHEAIEFDAERYPIINEDKCIGCGLCRSVCPVEDCISYIKAQKHHKQKREGIKPSSSPK